VLTTEQVELRTTPALETASSLAMADGSRARFSGPDEVLIGRRDGAILRWTPTAPAQPWLTVEGEVVAMSDVVDGQFLVGTREGEVTLWTLEGRRAFRLKLDLQASGVWLDRGIGRIYVAGGDSSLRAWDLAGKPRPTLEGHANSVAGVARLGPTLLITASEDGTLRVWDEDSGVPLAVLVGAGSSLTGVAVGPEGTWFYTASTAGQTSVFRVPVLDELSSRRRRLDCLAPFVLMGETLRRINRVECEAPPNRAKEQESL
jgi:WD40 repeat protein